MDNRILIIEDDIEIAHLLSLMVTKMGYCADMIFDGLEALTLLEQKEYDLILLDLMLPKISGDTLLNVIRKNNDLKVIVISAKSDVTDKVKLLELGADDYITKPFENKEVEARIQVQLRNVSSKSDKNLSHRDLELDILKREVSLKNKSIKLTNSEFDILTELMKKPSIPISKREIYECVRTGTYLGDDNTISVHVSNIRKKFEAITDEPYIKTVWGIGFMLI